jgi:biopolymer transport protein ExbD
MRLRRPDDKPQPETIVALIDIVFFLLVFFILIGRMDATAPFDVIPPTAHSGSDLPAGGMTIAVDSDGSLALDGAVLERGTVLGKAEARLLSDPDLLMRINADQAAPLRFVLPLISDLEALGYKDVVLIVTPNPP